MLSNLVEFSNTNSGFIQLILSAILTITTVIYCYITYRIMISNNHNIKIMLNPYFELTICVSNKYPKDTHNGYDFVIRNIGAGPAYSVEMYYAEYLDGLLKYEGTQYCEIIHSNDYIIRLGNYSHPYTYNEDGKKIESNDDIKLIFTVKYSNYNGEEKSTSREIISNAIRKSIYFRDIEFDQIDEEIVRNEKVKRFHKYFFFDVMHVKRRRINRKEWEKKM